MKPGNRLRLLTISACSLFTLSILFPFLEAAWQGMKIPEAIIGRETFWSFKYHVIYGWNYGNLVVVNEDRWFADYWQFLPVGIGRIEAWISPVLIFMFEAQILCVLFAALSLFRLKPYLLLSSTILNAFTTFGMLFVTQALSHEYAKTLQAGFWLTIPSAALFLAAAFLSSRQQKRARPDT